MCVRERQTRDLYSGRAVVLQGQAEARRQAPMQIACERVDAAARAQLQHLGERNEEGGLETRLDRGAQQEQGANLERKRPQSVAPERVAMGETDLEPVLDAVIEYRAPV